MNKTLRNALIAAGTAVALVLALPYLVPLNAYRGRIEATAQNATGRPMRIEGPLRLMFFPRLGVRAHEVTLANVPGGRAKVLAAVGDIELSVRVLPLVTGHLELDRIVLNRPAIALEVDPAGNANWHFARQPQPVAKKTGGITLPAGTEFAGLRIYDGSITYDNTKTRTHRAVEHVNIAVDLTRTDAPVALTGDLMVSGRKVDFTGRLATLKTFLGAGTTSLELAVHADLLHAAFKGQMTPDGATEGDLKLDSPSFRDLTSWLGTPLPGGGLGALSLAGHIQNKDKVTRLVGLRVTLDNQHMTGQLAIDAAPKVPVLDGALAVDHLDLNPYLTSQGHPATPAPAAPPQFAAPAGWSRAPFSLALLKEFDGKLSLSTGSLKLRNLRLGQTSLRLDNQAGVLNAWLDPVSLYGGSGQAQFTVDVRGPLPTIHNTLTFKNVALRPLLTDMLGLDSIEGTGALALDVTARGDNASAVMHSLAGKGAIVGANGRFRNVDLGAVARSIQTVLGGTATGADANTDFHQMGGSFVIAQGVLSNSDFTLAGPVVQMSGTGQIDIGNRTIDFRMTPTASVSGFSLGVPFRIRGSWDRVHYAPDYAKIINGVVDSIKSGGDMLKGLFGIGKQKQQQPNTPKTKNKSAGDTLKDMLGIH